MYSAYNKPGSAGSADWIYSSEIFVASKEATVCKTCCNCCVQTQQDDLLREAQPNIPQKFKICFPALLQLFVQQTLAIAVLLSKKLGSTSCICTFPLIFASFNLRVHICLLNPVSRQMCKHIHSSRCVYVLSYVYLLVSSTSCPTSLL